MSATIKSSTDGNTTTIGTNGGDTLAINSTGNVGIGDTTPTDAKLKVYANSALAAMRVVQEGTGNSFEVHDDATDTSPFIIDSSGNVKIDGNGDFRLNKPADAWSGTYIDIDKKGSLSHQGSFEVNLTSNGYRTSDDKWATLSAYNNNIDGAAQLRLSPNGHIRLATNATKGNGSSINPTTRLTVNDTGTTIAGKLDVSQNSTEAALNVTQVGTGLAIKVNDMPSDNSPFVVNSSGHVGIGIATPTAMLHLSSIEDTLPAVKITNARLGGDSFIIEDQSADPSPFIIKNNGDVGIGITIPTQKLHVVGNIYSTNQIIATDRFMSFGRNGKGGMHFGGETTLSGSAPVADGAVFQYQENLFGTAYDGLLIEKTDANATVAPDGGILFANRAMDGITVPALAIRGTGRVGIGTKYPSEKLQVEGNIKVSGNINANALIQKSAVKIAAATLTVDEIVQGYIITTGATYSLTLPTGPNFDSGYTSTFGSTLAIGDMVEFTILNNASGTVTLVVASGITDTSVGTLGVTSNTVKRFFLRKTGTSQFSLYAGA